MSLLFQPLPQRSLTMKNRIVVSPMCQYACIDGMPNDWHLVHLGSRAVGGAAVVMTEACAVSPEGRISPDDAGIWSDAQAREWSRIARFIAANGAIPAIQLAHAGRKASTFAPWRGHGEVTQGDGGWQTVAPSPLAYSGGYPLPLALDGDGIAAVVEDFRKAARRALDAGFQLVEVHAAHGYLLHQFLSPLSNQRTDGYGGSFDNRVRIVHEVIRAVRGAWPDTLPLWLRISASDWVEGGWDIDQSVALAKTVAALGVDLVDTSSGGLSPLQRIPVEADYQVPFASSIRHDANIATGAVGLITEAGQAEAILQRGDADVVLLAREFLRDPYFAKNAANALGEKITPPDQYLRAW